jgi:NADPH:quinone reductase
MKAVGLYKHLPIEDPQSLVDLDIQEPKHPTGHDLTIKLSLNPVDTKVRRGTILPTENENMPRILGWDAAGIKFQDCCKHCGTEAQGMLGAFPH